jgi:hypothetical protein
MATKSVIDKKTGRLVDIPVNQSSLCSKLKEITFNAGSDCSSNLI